MPMYVHALRIQHLFCCLVCAPALPAAAPSQTRRLQQLVMAVGAAGEVARRVVGPRRIGRIHVVRVPAPFRSRTARPVELCTARPVGLCIS